MIYMPREIANRPCTFTRSIYLWIVHIESKGNICHIFFKLKKKINLMLATVCNVYIHLRLRIINHVNCTKTLIGWKKITSKSQTFLKNSKCSKIY